MREIKFRAWDIEAKEIRLVRAEDLLSNEFKLFYKRHGELMQFTGLKDKNGKEIYEGDYLQSEPDGDGDHILHRVVWDEEKARFSIEWWMGEKDWEEHDEVIWGIEDIAKEMEIIGNIYENPELLSPNTNEE